MTIKDLLLKSLKSNLEELRSECAETEKIFEKRIADVEAMSEEEVDALTDGKLADGSDAKDTCRYLAKQLTAPRPKKIDLAKPVSTEEAQTETAPE